MGEHRAELSTIPQWIGDPPGFKRWQQEVKIFRLGKDMNKEVSYAAELIVGLSGGARSAALQLTEDELWPQRKIMREAQDEADLADDFDDAGARAAPRWVTNKEVNYMAIDTLVRRLERDLLQSKPVQRGERMEMFFGTNKFQRRRGMHAHDGVQLVVAEGL